MCDMSSRADAINNNKSIVRFRLFVIFSHIWQIFSIINFMIRLLQTHLFR